MTFWFDTDHSSWTFDEDEQSQPPCRAWVSLSAVMIVCAGAAAATLVLQLLGT